MMSDVDWARLVDEEDVEGLWNGLYQLISRHPAVRPLHFATDGAAVASAVEINADLTQELFLELFQKRRFDHYANQAYETAQIDNELSHIEIPNLVGARLRKRYPESFRMARRVSALLKSSARFRQMGDAEPDADATVAKPTRSRPVKAAAVPADGRGKAARHNGLPPAELVEGLAAAFEDEEDDTAAQRPRAAKHRRRMVSRVFGLKEWPAGKPLTDSGHFTQLVKTVPMRKRDTRLVGRSGNSQLIISNTDLEELIVEVFRAIDSPADVRRIRQLVLSKIPLQDYNAASLDEQHAVGSDGSTVRHEAADQRHSPEDELLREERFARASLLADDFLSSLHRAVNHNEKRFSRVVSTLWHCYYDPRGLSQLEIAELLGVSDSLVSDTRRLIEKELRKLHLSVDDGVVFNESLLQLVLQLEPAGAELAHS